MRLIGFEEHYKLRQIDEANPHHPLTVEMEVLRKAGLASTGSRGEWPAGIYDLGAGRVAAMDAAGIDMQILSHTVPGPETLEPSLAIGLAKQANDAVAAAIAKYPNRFRGFATLPMRAPTDAASELERAVRDRGLVGALINGHVDETYLDDKFFWPVFECAESLGVPIYIHPTLPPKAVIDAYYRGFDPAVSAKFFTAGSGWHIDTGIHCLRLILGGVFDRFPQLQIIVGHQFEALSWMVWRADYSFPPEQTGLKRTIREYMRNNFYGGILAGEYAHQSPGALDSGWSMSYSAYQCMLNVIGIDRIVFTTDYPYGNIEAARRFFDQMPISPSDKEKIAHLNAERLFGQALSGQPL